MSCLAESIKQQDTKMQTLATQLTQEATLAVMQGCSVLNNSSIIENIFQVHAIIKKF